MVVDALPAALRAGERAALRDLAEFVRQRFGARVRDLRLFGSRARSEGHEESDLDVLVVVDDLSADERMAIWNHSGRLLEQHDVMVSTFTVSTERWMQLQSGQRLIAREIERDGIRL